MTILRAGCYERVSTEEQALRGFSIDAQIANLTEYCEENNLKLVGHYTDAGISGSLSPLKRPALQQLLEDVQAGKIDIILFTKLDRWFRSVKEYLKVQEILDRCEVEWKAIHEDYDTSTANGRFAITIFLAIAQNEREKTSERIKAIYAYKRKNKEAWFAGRSRPFGFIKEKDADGIYRLVKNPEEKQMCADFWKILIEHDNLNMATRHMYNVYGMKKLSTSWRHIARQPFYYGTYAGIEGYCEAYISKDEWDLVQARLDARKHDSSPKKVYLFSSLMHCPQCGATLNGSFSTHISRHGKKTFTHTYRCRHRSKFCDYSRTLSESTLEKTLCKKLPELIQKEITAVEQEAAIQKAKPKSNLAGLREKLRTLNASYMAGNKSDEDYIKESTELKALIAQAEQEAPPAERDLTPLKKLLHDDFSSIYPSFSQEEKRDFWHNLFEEIKIADNQIIGVKWRI